MIDLELLFRVLELDKTEVEECVPPGKLRKEILEKIEEGRDSEDG